MRLCFCLLLSLCALAQAASSTGPQAVATGPQAVAAVASSQGLGPQSPDSQTPDSRGLALQGLFQPFAQGPAEARGKIVPLKSHERGREAAFRIEVLGGIGTGFFISPTGEALTAYHVVEGQDEVSIVTSSRGRVRARVVGYSELHDLALLQAEVAGTVPFLRLSERSPKVGEIAVVLGNHGGLLRPKPGRLSEINASSERRDYPSGTLAISPQNAPVGPGDSGGPLVNEAGEALGVTSYIRYGEERLPTAYVVPLAEGSALLTALRRGLQERLKVGRLGLENALPRQPDAAALAEMGLGSRAGAVFTGVEAGSPAARAGLRPLQLAQAGRAGVPPVFSGDVIVAVGGEAVENFAQLIDELRRFEPGQRVVLTVMRSGRENRIALTLTD